MMTTTTDLLSAAVLSKESKSTLSKALFLMLVVFLELTPTVQSLSSSSSVSPSKPSLSKPFLLTTEQLATIDQGGVCVARNFLSSDLVRRMRCDALQLFEQGYFVPDGLTNAALSKNTDQGFQKQADRQTFRGGAGWDDAGAGDLKTRREFDMILKQLLTELAGGLQRPTVLTEGSKNIPKHETTYNLYEPGASLGRHLDEHHEETKGSRGWLLPTRRSVTWLVYLNEDWNAIEAEGGTLRCFPRRLFAGTAQQQQRRSVATTTATDPPVLVGGGGVGAHDGNLQVGWLDEIQPVYLDAWRTTSSTSSGSSLGQYQSALYRLVLAEEDDNDDGYRRRRRRDYISQVDFDVPKQPVVFADFIKPTYRSRFEQISTARLDPRFAAVTTSGPGQVVAAKNSGNDDADKGQYTLDVVPTAGTLVLFDSVSLPHKVLTVTGSRRRIAATGWFHEDSQGLPPTDDAYTA